MRHLLFLAATIIVLAGFCLLVELEARSGRRVLARERQQLDETVTRAQFLWTHVDLFAFAKEELRALLARVSHEIAHLVLRAVRLVERTLTRVVRRLRSTAVENEAPRETAREFVRTLSDFKETLDATHPEIQAIEEDKQTPQKETPP